MNIVEENAMRSLLERCGESAAGVILRLAWQAGLRRREIQSLTWEQVDFMEWKLLLKDRKADMPMELAVFLSPLAGRGAVVASQRTGEALDAQTISHLARAALTEGGLEQVQLIDLRSDCARRRLAAGEGWQQVSRSLGMSAAALRALGAPSTRTEGEPRAKAAAVERLIEKEGPTPAGLAIALAWRQELGLEEILSLRWEQVRCGALHMEKKTLPLDARTQKLLDRREKNGAWVLTTSGGRPYDRSRLSREVRETFVRGGLDGLTLRSLRSLRQSDGTDEEILKRASAPGGISARELQETVSLPEAALRRRLGQLTQSGKLTRVGFRYYLPGAVVAPQRQEEAVLAYITEEGFAYRQDIARLLRIPPQQCRSVLRRMVERGVLRLEEQKYIPGAIDITK